ncbi:hypothetical protein FQ087_04705 [Sporosarcina sp. ANT_H38]|uniref:ABC transporter permease subunit n=1 Tax=Sporosarcina sp. ANT_H38 TaxID=2597358 RepID=UPI0011F1DB2F|nr:hypothetical protein [Sporosarcina sp. ANT_H38]KAA0966987.1 hypothetical protein FQ087_04705 [Sporosarcina sp. ANT_H38]
MENCVRPNHERVYLALLVVIIAVFIGHYTRFGRNMYATGGSEQSAVLIGLPIGKTKIVIYTISGFCASLSGLVFTFYMLLGYGLHANGSLSLEVMLKKYNLGTIINHVTMDQ